MSDTTLRDQLIRLAYENPNVRDRVLPLLKEAGGKPGTLTFVYQTRKASLWTLEAVAMVPLLSGSITLSTLDQWHKEVRQVIVAGYDSVHAVVKRLTGHGEKALGVKIRQGNSYDDRIAIVGKNVVFQYSMTLQSDGEVDPRKAELVAAALAMEVEPSYEFKYQNGG